MPRLVEVSGCGDVGAPRWIGRCGNSGQPFLSFDHPLFLSCSRATSGPPFPSLLELLREHRCKHRCSSTRPSRTPPSSPCASTLQPPPFPSPPVRPFPSRRSSTSGPTRARSRPHGRAGEEDRLRRTWASRGCKLAPVCSLWRPLATEQVGSTRDPALVDAAQLDAALKTRSSSPHPRRSAHRTPTRLCAISLSPNRSRFLFLDASPANRRILTRPSPPHTLLHFPAIDSFTLL